MSNAVFPVMPGLDIAVGKDPEFSTIIQGSATGKELRMAQRAYPIWMHKLKFNFLRDTAAFPELKQLMGFYLARLGPADNFLFIDTDDQAVTDQALGVGNGAQVDFQLVRSFGVYVEPVFNPNTITNVRVNGVGAAYTLQPNGVVRLSVAAPSTQPVTATFSYYYRSRFAEDRMSVEKFLHQVWSGKSVGLVSSLQDKI